LAARWYREGTRRPEGKAQLRLGQLAERGWGIEQNLADAAHLFEQTAQHRKRRTREVYERTAELGHAKGITNLGRLHVRRLGTPKDLEKALAPFQEAAALGSDDAQTHLRTTHLCGRGTAVNEAQAIEWRHKASKQGDAAAMSMLRCALHRGRPRRNKWQRGTLGYNAQLWLSIFMR
jgi:TPR repeat protein